MGTSYYLRSKPSDDGMIELLKNLTDVLIRHFDERSDTKWTWFEDLLAYDNAILPLALLHASEILNDEKVREVAFVSMDFLTKHTMKDGYLSIIGNKKWYKKSGELSKFAQQPLDAMAMVLMFHKAYHLTKNRDFLTQLFTSFMWFLGDNDLRMNLYDFETKGCCDGLESYGVNRNQGAESILAYTISYLTVLEAHEEYYEV
jgi:hypothetical protein